MRFSFCSLSSSGKTRRSSCWKHQPPQPIPAPCDFIRPRRAPLRPLTILSCGSLCRCREVLPLPNVRFPLREKIRKSCGTNTFPRSFHRQGTPLTFCRYALVRKHRKQVTSRLSSVHSPVLTPHATHRGKRPERCIGRPIGRSRIARRVSPETPVLESVVISPPKGWCCAGRAVAIVRGTFAA